MDYIFNEELDKKFSRFREAKQLLSIVGSTDDSLIDVNAVRKEFMYYSLCGIIYLGCLMRYLRHKSRFYISTGKYKKIFLHIVPFGVTNLIVFNKSLEFIFDNVVKKKFIEKLLEKSKNEPGYENRKKLLINQLTYYSNHKKNHI